MRNIIKFLLLSLIVLSSHAIEPVTKMQKINVVIPYPAGSGPDKVFRAIEAHVKKKNIEFVPVYKPGADGIIGAEYALNMPADGNTIMLTVISDIARDHPAKKFRVTDFASISAVCNSSIYIVANSQVAVNNISDLFGQIKKNPQSVSWGIISKNFETNLEWFANKAGYSKDEMLYTRFNAGFDISVSNIAGGFVDHVIGEHNDKTNN